MPSTSTPAISAPLTKRGLTYTQYYCNMGGDADLTFTVPTGQRWWIVGINKTDNVACTLVFKTASTTIQSVVMASGEKIGFTKGAGSGVFLTGNIGESLVISCTTANIFTLALYVGTYPPFSE